jgi:hypothetical protein
VPAARAGPRCARLGLLLLLLLLLEVVLLLLLLLQVRGLPRASKPWLVLLLLLLLQVGLLQHHWQLLGQLLLLRQPPRPDPAAASVAAAWLSRPPAYAASLPWLGLLLLLLLGVQQLQEPPAAAAAAAAVGLCCAPFHSAPYCGCVCGLCCGSWSSRAHAMAAVHSGNVLACAGMCWHVLAVPTCHPLLQIVEHCASFPPGTHPPNSSLCAMQL